MKLSGIRGKEEDKCYALYALEFFIETIMSSLWPIWGSEAGEERWVQPRAGLGSNVAHYCFGHLALSSSWNEPQTPIWLGECKGVGQEQSSHLACHDYTQPVWFFWLDSARHPEVWGLSSCTRRMDHPLVEDEGERQKARGPEPGVHQTLPISLSQEQPNPYLWSLTVKGTDLSLTAWVWLLALPFISWVTSRRSYSLSVPHL